MSEEKPNPETLEEIYNLVRGSLDRQADEGQMLDSKMVQIFSAASIVVGLAGFSISSGAVVNTPAALLLFLAFVAYAVVAYVAFKHLTPKTYYLLNYPDVWRKSWSDNPSELHYSVITKVTEEYERNRPTLIDKAGLIRVSIAAAGVEVVLIGLAITSTLFG